jgi:hypothetical protein
LEQAALQLRRKYPRWGKNKLPALLRSGGPRGLVLDGRPHPDTAQAPWAVGRADLLRSITISRKKYRF